MLLILQKNSCRIIYAVCFLLVQFGLVPELCTADTNGRFAIDKIQLTASPYRILITLNRKPEYKVVQIDKREVIIAFKGVSLSDNFQKKGSAEPLINKIRFESLPNNAVSLVVSTTRDLQGVTSEWMKHANTLAVYFSRPKVIHKTRANLKRKDRKKIKEAFSGKRTTPEQHIVETTLPVTGARKAGGSRFKGTIDDILEVMSSDSCARQETIGIALESCKKEYWDEAIAALERYIRSENAAQCLEAAYFLMDYATYKKTGGDDTAQYVEVVNQIQSTTTRFPDSEYMPYAMASLGKLYLKLGNEAEAKGYFKIVIDKYTEYKGIPEIIFELALIDVQKKEYKDAIPLYKKILSDYSYYAMLSDVRLELGKAYFETNNFSKAISVLNQVKKEHPKKVYESSDLLLFIGNSYYHTGKYKEARGILSEVYNLYPDMPTAHVVLTRIGDILVDDDQLDRAKKIFTLVTEKYPGTDGYIISSIRLAKFQEDRAEKEKIYQKIISEYPDHPMANLARLRLAEIEYNAGEYEKAILSINDLLLENPKALIREATFLKKESFQSLFQDLMSREDYPKILSAYEKDRSAINRFDDSPEVFLLVGKSYYLGYLYSESVRLLEKSYKSYEDRKKPGDLLFMLGMSLHETGKTEDAMKYYDEYIKGYPKGDKAAEIYRRIGRIYAGKNMDREAVAGYDKAIQNSREDREKAEILCEYGRYKLEKQDYKTSAAFLYEAVDLLNRIPEDHTALLLQAYRNIGEAEMHLESYSKAAAAFASAIERTAKEEDRIGLSYMLGESYHKNNKYKEAAKIYKSVAASGDAFWGKLAEEKLKGIELAEKLKNT